MRSRLSKPSPSFIHPCRGRLLAAALLVAGAGACASPGAHGTVRARLLAINDFHGQIGAGRTGSAGPNAEVGGAAVLAAWLKRARAGAEDRTVLVSAGDLVSASPADSALLQDEPTIQLLNALANRACDEPLSPHCDVVATVGNHEFDRGVVELRRLLGGGNHADGPFLENPWPGARYPYVAANVIEDATRRPLLPPYVIKTVGGLPIAFIGAVLRGTPGIAGDTEGLTFVDEAEAINGYIPELRAKGVRAIVVVIHQGGTQEPYAGPTDPSKPTVTGALVPIVNRLDGEVDVVVAGHTHAFANALVKNAAGGDVLVTQAWSAGSAFSEIDLELDVHSREIVAKSATIVPAFARAADGAAAVEPDREVARLVSAADAHVAPRVSVVVGQAATDVTRAQNAAGESALGELIADAMRAAGGTDFAITHTGGIRNDLHAGTVTWGDLFAVQPFRRRLATLTLTGQQLYDLLAEQWANPNWTNTLQISGFSYSWRSNGPGRAGTVLEVRKDGRPIDRSATYSVTTTGHLAGGGGGFTGFKVGRDRSTSVEVVEALQRFIGTLGRPLAAVTDGRVTRVD